MNDLLLKESHGKVLLIRLNRPYQKNALSTALMQELCGLLAAADGDDLIAAVVLTGGDNFFSAGADIQEMHDMDFSTAFKQNYITAAWKDLHAFRKPLIAAVAGYALGGGCELAMICDIILAEPNTSFGQPEIRLGLMPGGGGTQRLTRLVGKSMAMEICLAGRLLTAEEALSWGLVSRMVAKEDLLTKAIELGQKISQFSAPAIALIKEAINKAYELPLTQACELERRMFHAALALQDSREGRKAFIEKRKPRFLDS